MTDVRGIFHVPTCFPVINVSRSLPDVIDYERCCWELIMVGINLLSYCL